MALLRVVHGASMPDPGELARLLQNGPVPAPVSTAKQISGESPAAGASTSALPMNFTELVAQLDKSGFVNLAATMHDVVRVVAFAPPSLKFKAAGPVHQGFLSELREALFRATGERWDVEVAEGEAQPTLLELERLQEAQANREILESPLVKAALDAFPDAEVSVDGRLISPDRQAEVRSLRA
jgi:DNA polymerase-3 subunit gamma/tau